MLQPLAGSHNNGSSTNLSGGNSTLVDLKEVNENHLYHQDRDVVWVCVIHGRKTSLAMCAIEWVGSLASLALLIDVGVPEGSALLFLGNILLFFSCWLFLLPSFVKITHALKKLVFLVSVYCLGLGVFVFVAAALASNAFDQCQGVDVSLHICSKLQASISITFITAFATLATFLVIFLGSIKPPEMTFKSYLKSNFRRGGGDGGGEGMDAGEFENVPLGQVRPNSTPLRPSQLHQQQRNSALDRDEEEDEANDNDDDDEEARLGRRQQQGGRRLDAFEII